MADQIGRRFEGFANVQRQDSSLPWAVYTGEEESSNRPVRLSVLWAPEHMSAERRRSVLDWFAEAGYQSQRLASPLIPAVLGYRSDEDVAWVAVERPRGRPLREVIVSEGPLEPERAMLISGHIAAALAPAHDAGWAHGWLNGDTVWLGDDDSVAVVDLGLGLAIGPVTGGLQQPFHARTGLLATDPRRQDLQSLGLLCTWMLTGRLPDPVGIPRADAFPKTVPADVIRRIRALIDPESHDYLTAADWRSYSGVEAGAESTTGAEFYETASHARSWLPGWAKPAAAVLALLIIAWLAARFLAAPGPGMQAATDVSAPTASGRTGTADSLTAVQVGPVQPENEQATRDFLAGMGFSTISRNDGGRVFIQVGAFASPDGAETVRRQLQDAGFSVRLVPTVRPASPKP